MRNRNDFENVGHLFWQQKHLYLYNKYQSQTRIQKSNNDAKSLMSRSYFGFSIYNLSNFFFRHLNLIIDINQNEFIIVPGWH